MTKLIPPALLLSSLVLLSTRAICAQPSAAETRKTLEEIRAKHDLPALAYAVIQDGVIRGHDAVGIRKQGDATPVTPVDAFHIGSCTKSMTATLAGMLIDDGKLRWDSTILEVFPNLKGKIHEQYEKVTLEQLLQNRGGVPGSPPSAAWKQAWQQKGTPAEQRKAFIAAVLAEKPESPPGTKMIYSNQGYTVAGMMLEKVTGKSWEDLVTERLFKPLGMMTAGFGPPGTEGKVDQPWGHTRKDKTNSPVQGDNPPAVAPAGLVHCSLEDFAKYVQLHLQSDKAPKLIKPATLERLHTAASGGDYACGWIVLKRPWAGGNALMHNGSNTMWYAVMWLAPSKKFAVIAATNVGGDDATKACDEVAASIIGAWLK